MSKHGLVLDTVIRDVDSFFGKLAISSAEVSLLLQMCVSCDG